MSAIKNREGVDWQGLARCQLEHVLFIRRDIRGPYRAFSVLGYEEYADNGGRLERTEDTSATRTRGGGALGSGRRGGKCRRAPRTIAERPWQPLLLGLELPSRRLPRRLRLSLLPNIAFPASHVSDGRGQRVLL